jgi:transposase
LFSAIRARAAG